MTGWSPSGKRLALTVSALVGAAVVLALLLPGLSPGIGQDPMQAMLHNSGDRVTSGDADTGASSWTVPRPPASAARARRPAEPSAAGPGQPDDSPPAPDGNAWTTVVDMTTQRISERSATATRAAPWPVWLHAPDAPARLARSGPSADRDWTFAWVAVASGTSTAALRAALERHGATVLGRTGALWRARVPIDLERLRAIKELPDVAALGYPRPDEKIAPGFADLIRTGSGGEVAAVFVTLMGGDPNDRYRRILERLGMTVEGWDADVRAYSGQLPHRNLDAVLRSDFVLAVEPNAVVLPAHAEAVPSLGGDRLRRFRRSRGTFVGRTGALAPVGIMDTGLNIAHPDISTGRHSVCGRNFVPGEDYALWRDLTPFSGAGHGTLVAGSLLGSGALDPLMAGVAPGVRHVRFAKVLANLGRGRTDYVLRGMDYLAEVSDCKWEGLPAAAVRPMIVNMSLASVGLEHSGRSIGERKLDATAWARRQLFVVSQANSGVHGLSNFATAKNSLAVGAATGSGVVASFSSHGPTADGRLSPALVAPGVDVQSPRGEGVSAGYASTSGTSAAAPMVAGAAAVLMSHVPDFRWQPALVRARLMASAVRPDAVLGAGASLDNTDGPGAFQNRYGLGLASARLAVLQRDTEDGWITGAAVAEPSENEFAYVDIDVPAGASRLDVVMTWDEGPADAVAQSVLHDLDLWLDAGGDCSAAACGEFSSRSVVDNVEWIFVPHPEPGRHRIKVVPARVAGTAPRAAVAWTVIRGASTPRLSVTANPRLAGETVEIDLVEIDLTVTSDAYVAAGTTLAAVVSPPNVDVRGRAEIDREDDLTQVIDWRPSDVLELGELAVGERQRVRLAYPKNVESGHTFHFIASSWNAHSGTVQVQALEDRAQSIATAAPPGDDFAEALQIRGRSGEAPVDLTLASREPGELEVDGDLARCGHGCASAAFAKSRSVWFNWRAPSTGLYSFRIVALEQAGGATEVSIGVYRGQRVAALEEIGANHDGAIAFAALRDRTYRIRVATTSQHEQDHVLQWQGDDEPPANDDFRNAERIAGASGRAFGNNSGAGLEANEFFGEVTATVWYRWRAPHDGAWLWGANGREVLTFTGTSLATLRLVGSPNFRAAAGKTYFIAVGSDGTETAGGPFTLSWGTTDSGGYLNDDFAAATVLAGANGRVPEMRGRSIATVEPGEPVETGTRTLWWRWEPPANGRYTWRLGLSRASQSRITVFAGETLDELVWVAGGSEIVVDVEAGRAYFIAVGMREDATFDTGSGTGLDMAWGPTPGNDRPASALALKGVRGRVAAQHLYATTSDDEPVGVAGHSSLWWTWRAPASGWFRFVLEPRNPADEQPILGLYRTGGDGQPELLRTTDRSFVISGYAETAVQAAAGDRYLIQVAERAPDWPGQSARGTGGNTEFSWLAGTPRWLRMRGVLREDDGLPPDTGSIQPGGIAMDDAGRRVFVNAGGGLLLFDRAPATGALTFTESVAISTYEQDALGWDPRQGVLYGFGNEVGVLWSADPAAPQQERCGDDPPTNVSASRVLMRGGFAYVLSGPSNGAVLVYRLRSRCDIELVQVLSGERLGHPAAVHVAELTSLRGGAFSADARHLYLSGESALLGFGRDVETGELRLVSELRTGDIGGRGHQVWLPGDRPGDLASDSAGQVLFVFRELGDEPNVAAFDLTSDPGRPTPIGRVQGFHARGLRTHLEPSLPSWLSECSAAAGGASAAHAMCRYSLLVHWDPATASVRISDLAGPDLPDRFDNEVPAFRDVCAMTASPDGRHAYAASCHEAGIAVVEVLGGDE